jgi:NAD(P)-dependent dehydrogenase (short-subunit alcohol dehydrogenase family)
MGVAADVADFAAMQELARSAYDAYGAVHLVHLNAGIAGGGSFFDDVTTDWPPVIDVNLKGVMWGIKAFAQRMVDGGDEGYIIATSSSAGIDGTTYTRAGYGATKIAVLSLMESFYGQLRDKQSKVRAGVLFPPPTATNLFGGPEAMKGAATSLRSRGVPATVVQPERVAELLLDGLKRDRFFIRVGRDESARLFDGQFGDAYIQWSEPLVRGRAEAVLTDGKPDAYLW